LQAATAAIVEALQQARCHSGVAPEMLAVKHVFYCQKKLAKMTSDKRKRDETEH
jgi:hypothetical protein